MFELREGLEIGGRVSEKKGLTEGRVRVWRGDGRSGRVRGKGGLLMLIEEDGLERLMENGGKEIWATLRISSKGDKENDNGMRRWHVSLGIQKRTRG